MIVVTGATGQLGRLVIEALLKRVPAGQIVAAVRTLAKAEDLSVQGIAVREADYNRPDTLAEAFKGATKVLLISGNELGRRVEQHKLVIDAAKSAGAGLLAYTSVLRADRSPLILAEEHVATERYLRASGLAFSLLRNSWYFENHTAAIGSSIAQGAFIGCSGQGRFAAASRADYADAAAVVLTGTGHGNSMYELAGDHSYTRADLAREASRQVGKEIAYNNLPEAAYEKMLASFLPAVAARAIADAEQHAAQGWLDDDSHTLRQLIGRPTTTLTDAVASALRHPPTTH